MSGPSRDGKGKGGRCNVFGMCILYIYILGISWYIYMSFSYAVANRFDIFARIWRYKVNTSLGCWGCVLRVVGALRTSLHIWCVCVCVCYVSLSMALSSGCKGNGPTPLYHRGFLPIKTTSYWRVHTSMKSLWVGQNVALRPWTLETVRNLSLGQMSVAVAFPHPARTGENASWYFLFNMFRPKPWITFDTQTIGIWSIVLKTSKSRLSVTPSHGSFSHLVGFERWNRGLMTIVLNACFSGTTPSVSRSVNLRIPCAALKTDRGLQWGLASLSRCALASTERNTAVILESDIVTWIYVYT